MHGVKLVKGCYGRSFPHCQASRSPADGGHGQSHHYLLDSSSTTCKRRRLCLGIRPNGSGVFIVAAVSGYLASLPSDTLADPPGG
jgi:hypothetical protein